jgi:hypothetical protein
LKFSALDLRGREDVVAGCFVGQEGLAIDDEDGEGGPSVLANNHGLDGFLIATTE